MSLASALSLPINLLIFVALGAAIWFAGTRLAYLADAIGHRTGIDRAIMGLIFLAAITELPELVTTVTASAMGDAALALNNMFGGITMQTAVLAVADATVFGVTLTSYPRKPTPMLEGAFLILMLTTILVVISLGEIALVAGLGLGVTVLAGIYAFSIIILGKYDSAHGWRPMEIPEPKTERPRAARNALHGKSLRLLILQSCGIAAVILVCGVLLVDTAAEIADQSGLGSSFIGVTFLAAATSLPELSTTIAAVRMGAFTMAISNIFGSNLIMVLVLFPADIFYREGEILRQAGDTAQLALLSGIVVTTIYVIGLLVKKKPRVLGMGVDSLLVLCVYLVSVYGFYLAR